MSRNLTALGAFAAGAGIGAVVALLYAPRAGKHTRARIGNSATRLRHRAEEIQRDVRTHVEEFVDDASEMFSTKLASGKEAVHASKEQVLQVFDNVRECVDEGRERVEQYVRSLGT